MQNSETKISSAAVQGLLLQHYFRNYILLLNYLLEIRKLPFVYNHLGKNIKLTVLQWL
jgi:hypothetical protein